MEKIKQAEKYQKEELYAFIKKNKSEIFNIFDNETTTILEKN